ncbi:MAG: acyl CoA:acetate/3-ketoacid CoA transferase, partial [Candidatus Korarchaeota archaeon]|nr:acyl CoA:acetate/3-ketoacid CoA transferase [Candidatus Korarchaeota archaeon]
SGPIIPPITPNLLPKMELNARKVVARRIALEMVKLVNEKGGPILVNLGIGIPAMVTNVAAEEGISDYIVTTIESGPWGGLALMGEDFGVSIGPFAIIPMPDMFTNYEGGIIDAASLGFMQIDKEGNVNPSMLPNRMPGPGGFPVIAAGSPRVFFGGGFTAGKKKLKVEEGKLRIEMDGNVIKFVDNVYKIVFNGKVALEEGKEVLYITERAVFKLTDRGLVLEEVAPGIDLDRDLLSKMEFKPVVADDLREMDPRIFKEGKMGLKDEIKRG